MIPIVDTSVVLKWFIAEVGSEEALALTASALTAPDLLRAELANALATKVRTNQISAEQALAAQASVGSFLTFVPSMELADRALEIALEINHPAYDCIFLALAEILVGYVITADARFVSKCAGTRYGALVQEFA